MPWRLERIWKLEYYPYDKYKSPHTETPTSNRIGGGYSGVVKTQITKICLNFNFLEEGYSGVVKTQSAKICLNFNFPGGGFFDLKFQRGVFWRIWTQIYCAYTETCLCITDSLSHTMCVETNKIGAIWLHYVRIHSKFILDLRHCSNRSKGRGVMSHYFHGNLLCFAGTT